MFVVADLLKERGYLDELNLNVCVVGSRRFGDDWIDARLKSFAPRLSIFGFEADRAACTKMNEAIETAGNTWHEHHYPYAIGAHLKPSTLHITAFPDCTSLYEPNTPYLERFQGYAELTRVVSTTQVETYALDEVCQLESLPAFDCLLLDVQGAELDVLKGAAQAIERGILGMIVEVEFAPIYKKQPLFAEVDTFLRSQGFTLFGFDPVHVARTNIPVTNRARPGQLLWANAFYLRDPLSQMHPCLESPEQWLKLACVADLFMCPDYALEILVSLSERHKDDPRYNFSVLILDSVARTLQKLGKEEHFAQLPLVQRVSQLLPEEFQRFVEYAS